MTGNSPLYLIDASIYIFRAYFSIPDTFADTKGDSVNAVYGYMHFLLDLLLKEKPLIAAAAFDESLVSCYRNEFYPAYKANRDLPDENLLLQMGRCREVTGLLGIRGFCLKDYEADDIIGTLMKLLGKGRRSIILTRDKDLGQLLGDGDQLWDFAADRYSNADDIEAKFGIRPEQLPDFLALAGDFVDNIPGVRGIGAKTAAALLNEFGDLDNLLANLECVADCGLRGAAKIQEVLANSLSEIAVYRQITPIFRDIPMQVSIGDLALALPAREKIDEFCRRMRFGAVIGAKVDRLYGG